MPRNSGGFGQRAGRGRGTILAHILAGGTALAATIWADRLAAEGAAEVTDVQIVLPSGMRAAPLDTIQNAPGPEGLTVRFRFLAPQIAGTSADEETLGDMTWLCETYALPRLPVTGPVPEQVIVSLSDRPVAFGTTDPEATQFFEAFRPDGQICEWEAF